jgi:hypothetical protein
VSDLAKWKVHGQVRSVKTSFAEWDLAAEEWRVPQYHNQATFLPNGKLDETRHFNPDRTIARTKNLYDKGGLLIATQFWMDDSLQNQTLYTYDEARRHVRTISLTHDGREHEAEASTYDSRGLKTTVRFLYSPDGAGRISYWIEAAGQGISVPGAVAMTTIHDPNDQAAEILFHDAQNAVVGRVVLTRDESGRLVKAEFQIGDRHPFPEAAARGEKAGLPMDELLRKVFGPSRSFSKTTSSYDERGRLVERTTEMGLLSRERSAFRYDAHGNPIEEWTAQEDREFEADEQGELHVAKERSFTRHTRFQYEYDKQGNWTKRTVWGRLEPNPNFERGNVEQREISYHVRAAR